ncbi:MAG: sialidase, partial [Acidobacteriota bacterium]
LQLTRDGAKTWSNVVANVPNLPKASWVSWVEASRHEPATAYAAFDRHTFGDLTPWVFKTADFGKTWTRIVSPEQGVRGYAHCVKEDTVRPSLLFVGTELGLWISPDAGKTWAEFKGGDFPSVAVRDIQVHPREGDLVLATHGRGIWIVDDLTPLRKLSADILASDAAFLAGRPTQQRMPASGGWVEGDASFVGRNPPGGAVITYYQRTRHLFGPIKLEIFDASGKLVDTLSATKHRGINRVVWPMQVKPPRVPRAATVAFAASQGPRVPPGTYTVRLTKGGKSIETKLEIGIDRRAPYTVEDRKAQFAAVMKAHALFERMSALVDRIDAARAAAARRARALPESDPGRRRLQETIDKLDAIKREIVATKEGGAITGEERIREHLDTVYGALNGWEGKPAAYQVERVETLGRELADVAREFDALAAGELKAQAEAKHAGAGGRRP